MNSETNHYCCFLQLARKMISVKFWCPWTVLVNSLVFVLSSGFLFLTYLDIKYLVSNKKKNTQAILYKQKITKSWGGELDYRSIHFKLLLVFPSHSSHSKISKLTAFHFHLETSSFINNYPPEQICQFW